MPEWVAFGKQEVNGYLRITATHKQLLVEGMGLRRLKSGDGKDSGALTAEDGHVQVFVMDCVMLVRE